MTHIPENSSLRSVARPNAITLIDHTFSSTQTLAVNNRIILNNSNNWFESFNPTINNDVITLPAGYYYYVESTIQAYRTSGWNGSEWTSIQHYDESSSSYFGTIGTVVTAGYGEDSKLWSRDSVARIIIDCASSSKDISIKIQANSGHSHINYNLGHWTYSGGGRTTIWQLNS